MRLDSGAVSIQRAMPVPGGVETSFTRAFVLQTFTMAPALGRTSPLTSQVFS